MSTLLVASTGGHLSQLRRLWPRLQAGGLDADAVWVTFDTAQSRAMLRDEQVEHLHFVAPRDVRNLLRNAPRARGLIRRHRPTAVVSTGSAIALAVLPWARLRGIPCHYVESAARSTGPSLTGRVMHATPGIRTYAQYPGWASRRWGYLGSVFDEYAPTPQPADAIEPRRVLVTLGTIPYGFERLVARLVAIVPPGVDVTWQLGGTEPTNELPGIVTRFMGADDLAAACRAADVVVAHAGIGSALMAMDAGRLPVLIPRRHAHGEHVDDHQEQIATELQRRRLAVTGAVEALTWPDLVQAANQHVARAPASTPMRLQG